MTTKNEIKATKKKNKIKIVSTKKKTPVKIPSKKTEQQKIETIREKKATVISTNESRPPVDISFQEWLLMGKKMGWDLESASIPMIVNTYDQDNDQIERHSKFLREMTKLYNATEDVLANIDNINNTFKTSDHSEIFDSELRANAEILKGVAEYYRTSTIEHKKSLYEKQAYLVYSRYKNDPDFQKHVDSFIKNKMTQEISNELRG